MDKTRSIQLLNIITDISNSSQTGAGWITAKCPMAPWMHDGGIDNNPSFGLNTEHADPFMNCFTCGMKGSATEWVYEIHRRNKVDKYRDYDFAKAMKLIQDSIEETPLLEDLPTYEEKMSQVSKEPTWFPDWWVETFPPALGIKWARNYLHDRHVSPELAMALNIRADTTQKRVCFPIRDFDSVYRGFHGRAVNPEAKPRYRMYQYLKESNPITWYGENWVDFNKPVLVVEGPFDLASAIRVYRNTISPLFANPSIAKIERMGDATEWVTLLDTGAGGEKGRQKFSHALKGYSLTQLRPPKDKDAGDMSEEELRYLLHDHLPLDDNPF